MNLPLSNTCICMSLLSRSPSETTLLIRHVSFTLQPVSYISLALTLGTGAGLLWYYSQVRDKKLSGMLPSAFTLEETLEPEHAYTFATIQHCRSSATDVRIGVVGLTACAGMLGPCVACIVERMRSSAVCRILTVTSDARHLLQRSGQSRSLLAWRP